MSKVSIIVPVYNTQQWLRLCVDSIVCQSVADWQLILVDDGSTDASPAICDEYAARHPRVNVIHKPNGGLSSARNAGLDVADGEFVIFIDSDDEVHPDLISLLLTMQSATDADICSASFVNRETYTFRQLHNEKFAVYTPEQAIATTLYQRKGLVNSVCNVLYKRHLFHSMRFTEGIGYEDLDFFYKIYAKANVIAHSSQVTYLYRANPTSYINTWSKSRLDVLTVTDRLVDYMSTHGSVELQKAAADRRFSAYFNIFNLATINNEPAVAQRCWKVIAERRLGELLNPNVRLKNKLGALVALCGRRFTAWIAKRVMSR
jgi:glycosyltransferase involved in cell wall biosynthesis